MSSMPLTALSKQSAKPVRDSNVELLRILAMCGVVILHYNNWNMGGGFLYVAPGSLNEKLLWGLESLCICAVNLFLLITGYFSCTSKRADPTKVAALLLQVVVFRLVEYGLQLLNGEAFATKRLLAAALPMNWFVVLYAALYLLSPYINHLLRGISVPQMKKLVIIAFVLLSVWPTLVAGVEEYTGKSLSGLSTISLTGNGEGYTLINFSLMYLIGAYLRIADLNIKKRYCMVGMTICTILTVVLSRRIAGTALSYCNPIVIVEAIFAFLLFRQMRFRSGIINTLAKGAFSCFLMHMVFLPHFQIAAAVQRSPLYLTGHILLTAVTIYLLCFAGYMIYEFISKPMIRLIGVLFRKMQWEIIVEE